ncbi:MAG TPA: hypothetical protein VE173_12845, partial [Longimicrobiales bacterium]|nr:hypothetical protein [Longimicrobiales bacterium]
MRIRARRHCLRLAALALAPLLGPWRPGALDAQTPRPGSPGSAVADTSAFRPLDLPAPNAYRTGSGRPGADYWQQRADYRIEATLDVDRNMLAGRETIHYENHSPDTLTYLWMFLDQNICAPGSVTDVLHQPPLVFQDAVFDFSCRGFPGGVNLDSLRVDGTEAERQVYGTIMRVELARPLPRGGSTELDVVWSFPVPEYGAGRMGRDGS